MRKLEQITNYKNRTPGAKPAFTLAEVLVTLVIIGVLATLTIPALITNIQDAQDKSAWKNASSIISQATRMLATDNGGSLNGIFGNSDVMRDKLSTYLSYMQKCDAGTALGSNGCWNANIFNLSGNDFTFWSTANMSNWSRLVLSNGMLVSFALESSNCTVNRSAKHNECGSIGVDLNGFKGPNTVGKDIYWGYITEDGSFEPFGKQNDYWDTYGSGGKAGCDLQKYSDAIGLTCAAQYLYQ